jgi:NAD(P)-dependent dehydrogenase (short-subunit alcohol dehydrogenase family)
VKPIPDAVAYKSSKAGLQQMTKSLALELGKTGVRVNGILPAVVETDMYRNRFPDPKEYEQVIEHMKGMHPLGRIGQPTDVANAALFLSSPQASWITGVLLPVDGGMLCT